MDKDDKTPNTRVFRTQLVVFIISALLFGISISLFSLGLSAVFVQPTPYILILAFVLILVSSFLAFKWIVPTIIVDNTVHCYFLYDIGERKPIMLNANYGFLTTTYHAVGELIKSDATKENDLIGKVPQTKLFNDLIFYSILAWFANVNMMHLIYAMRSKIPRAPRLHSDLKSINDLDMRPLISPIDNMFTKIPALQAGFALGRIPKGMHIDIESEKLVLSNGYVKITVSYQMGPRGTQGHNYKIAKLLKLSYQNNTVAFFAAYINFKAEFNPIWMLSSKSDIYWNYANELLENLIASYSLTAFLDDKKDELIWDKLTSSVRDCDWK